MKKASYMFTNKSHPIKGIISTILGIIDVTSLVLTIVFSYMSGGNATSRHAVNMLLAFMFSMVGLVIGIISRVEKDKFYLFPTLGIILNAVVLGFIIFMLVIGVS